MEEIVFSTEQPCREKIKNKRRLSSEFSIGISRYLVQRKCIEISVSNMFPSELKGEILQSPREHMY